MPMAALSQRIICPQIEYAEVEKLYRREKKMHYFLHIAVRVSIEREKT